MARRLQEYLEGLPQGLATYPECQTKTSVALSAIKGHDPVELAAGLPEELATVVLCPPPLGVWMPATVSDALFHAVCDKYYPTEEEMLHWCKLRTYDMAAHPLYRALLRVSGPRVFFSMAARLHGMFQRGTVLTNEELAQGRLVARMTFPAGLHNRFNLLSNNPLYAAAAELTGGQDSKCALVEYGESYGLYEITWT